VRSTSTINQSRTHGQPVLVLALLLAGLGNLIVPVVVQDLIPVDYLLVTLGACGIAILYHFRSVIARVGMWWPGLAFVILCVPGFLVSPLTSYGSTKAQALAVTVVIFVTCAVVINPPRFVMRFTVVTMMIGAAFTLAALQFGTLDIGGRLVFLGLNPIGIGRVAGLALVLSLTLVIVRKVTAPVAVLGLLGIAAITAVGVVATGSRGPLVAAGVALAGIAVFLVATKQLRPRVAFLILLAGVAAAGAVFLSDSAGLSRLSTATDSGRSSLYAESLRLALANPMGIGWGQLGQYIVDFRATDEESLYAHNVFLEVFVEGGLIALVAFTALVVACIVQAWRAARSNPQFTIVLVVLIYTVCSAQFSSDIVGNRLMWLYMGFSLMAGWWVRNDRSAVADLSVDPMSAIGTRTRQTRFKRASG
jgi:O-antigen ligase